MTFFIKEIEMKTLKILPVLALITLSACMSFETIEQAWPSLKGKNIQVAIDHLGIPNGKYTIDGRDVYVWSTSETYTSMVPTTSSTYGTVGNTGFNALSTSYQPKTSQLSCEIKILTTQRVMERIEYSGNNGACLTYSERLKPLVMEQ